MSVTRGKEEIVIIAETAGFALFSKPSHGFEDLFEMTLVLSHRHPLSLALFFTVILILFIPAIAPKTAKNNVF